MDASFPKDLLASILHQMILKAGGASVYGGAAWVTQRWCGRGGQVSSAGYGLLL
jgi:hypothetical protein